MLSKIPLLPFKIAGRVKDSLSSAYETAKGSKGFGKKIGVFLYDFSKTMLGFGKKKIETTEQTTRSVKLEVDKIIKKYRKKFGIKDKLLGGAKAKKEIDLTLAVFARNLSRVDSKAYQHAEKGLDAQKKAFEDDKDPVDELDFDQSTSLGAVAFMTLRGLKEKYKTSRKLKIALRRLAKASGKSKYSITKMLRFSVLGIFKVKNKDDRIRFLKKIGIKRSIMDIFGRGDMNDAADLLGCLSRRPLEEKKRDLLVKFFHKRLFPNTKPAKVQKIVALLHEKMTSGAKKMTIDNLGDLVFWINDKDFDGIAKLFTGKLRKRKVAKTTKAARKETVPELASSSSSKPSKADSAPEPASSASGSSDDDSKSKAA